ncbi:MAG: hypothetical protein R3F49_06185 [Planctomycetota bacterium]
MGRFETNDSHTNRWHQPVRVPRAKEGIFEAARELVEDLDGWTLERSDEAALTLYASKSNGLLGGTSKVTITVKGPQGIPSSETHVVSESSGGLFSKDRANVAAFCEKFWMRVT